MVRLEQSDNRKFCLLLGDFFLPARRLQIICSQTNFHIAYFNLLKSSSGGDGSVSKNQYFIKFELSQKH